MAETKIAWTDFTFNPWMGCYKISDGCKNCYAATLTTNRMGLNVWGKKAKRQITSVANWRKPVKWNKQAAKENKRYKVFSGSLCDVFEDRKDLVEPRANLFELIKATPSLDWLLLTKRPNNILNALPDDWGDGYQNVWMGTTVECEKEAWRMDELRKVPAVIRFISYEPAIAPLGDVDLTGISWVIYGGESGPGFRPHNVQWARDAMALSRKYGAAFFYKQSAAYRTGMGEELDGKIIREWPTPKTGTRKHFIL